MELVRWWWRWWCLRTGLVVHDGCHPSKRSPFHRKNPSTDDNLSCLSVASYRATLICRLIAGHYLETHETHSDRFSVITRPTSKGISLSIRETTSSPTKGIHKQRPSESSSIHQKTLVRTERKCQKEIERFFYTFSCFSGHLSNYQTKPNDKQNK